MSKAYEDRNAAGEKVLQLLGREGLEKFWIGRFALLTQQQHADCERNARPVIGRARALLDGALALAEEVRTSLPPSRERSLVLEKARDACTCLELALGAIRQLADDGPGGGEIPEVAAKPNRRDFIRIMLAKIWPEAIELDPRAWAYFAICAGMEDEVRGDVRSATEVWAVRRKAWRKDLADVACELVPGQEGKAGQATP
jgi:hypothetical protein